MSVTEETAFETFGTASHTDLDFGARSGNGGDDMGSWGSDETILNNLLKGTYTNNSSYSIPAAISEATVFDTFGKISNTQDSAIVGGSGGGDMQSWGSDSEIANNLISGTYTNASSYTIPAIVVETGTTFERYGSLSHGSNETGVEVGYTYLGTRISGNVYVSPNANEANPDLYTLSGVGLETEAEGVTFTASADPSNGEYALPLGPGGIYTVKVTHPALSGKEQTIDLQPGESQPDTQFVLSLPSGGGGFGRGRSIG